MRAPISVIIPTLNAEARLPRCLMSLMEGVQEGLLREVIVSDGGSVDGTEEIARASGAVWLSGAASRGGQLVRGCARAEGAWLLVLHADTVLEAGWTRAVAAHLDGGEQAGWFRLAFDHGGMPARLVAGWANLRSRMGLPYGDQGLLVPKTLYEAVGGYPDQPLMEDVALARALRGRLRKLDAVAVTSADKYVAQGWVRRGARNLTTLLGYGLGVPVEKLVHWYQRGRP